MSWHTVALVIPCTAIALAAQHMQQGFLRGVIFGTCVGLTYCFGRFVGKY